MPKTTKIASFRGLPLLAMLGALLLASPARADDARGSLRERLSGHFREAPGNSNAANRDAGIARAVDALFIMFRPIARSRITEANPAFPAVRIAFHDGQIETETPPVLAKSPENGEERTTFGLNKVVNKLVQSVAGDALVQKTWTEGAGSRTTRFVPSADGKRLTLFIEIRADRLPVPVAYSMEYVRVDP